MKSGWNWPVIIVAFLLADVVAMGITVAYSTGDSSHHVVPDYYQKAVAHDAVMDRDRRLLESGWRLGIAEIAPHPAGLSLTVRLTDASDHGIAGIAGAVSAYHQGHAGQVLTAPLQSSGDGDYTVVLAVRRTGLWVLDFTLAHPAGNVVLRLYKDLKGA